MTYFLISFPSGAMAVTDEELPEVAEDTHAVVRAAERAGVWVFGGGIDESVPPVLVDASGAVRSGTFPETARIDGGFAVLDVTMRDEALAWAARFAEACRCPQEVRAFADDPER